MGITTDEFFENIYSVIFSPKAFYENKDVKISIRVALGTIFFISILIKLTSSIFDGSIMTLTFFSSMFFHIVTTIFLWFFTALFFEYCFKIFNNENNLSKILYYTAFAPIPYIFYAPLNLVKQAGLLGYFFGSIIEFLLYFWIIFLYAYSLRAAYNITISRAFMLIFLPFVASIFAINWMVCFVSKLWYIFSI